MDRATMLRLGLPLVERLVTTLALRDLGRVAYRRPGEDGDDAVAYIAIFGPSRDELAAVAPALLHTVDFGSVAGEPGAFHAPIHTIADLRPAMERYWEHVRTYGENAVELNVVVLPPGVAVRRTFARELAAVPGGEVTGTAAAVLLTTLLTGRCVVLGPDGRLAEPELRPTLDWCFAPYVEFARKGILPVEFSDALHFQRKADAQAAPEDPSAERIPRQPDFVWSLHADATPSDADAAVVMKMNRTFSGNTVHFRRLSEPAAVALGKDAAAIDKLFDVAVGAGIRGEDDRIVPKIEIAAAGKWDAGWVDRDWATAADFARSHGYAMRALGRICETIGRATDTVAPDLLRRSVWFDDGRPTRDENEIGSDAVWLLCHDEADAEFVWRSLGDVQLTIACQAMGSLSKPRVSPQLLAEVGVPWPDADQRAALLAGLRRTGLTKAAKAELEIAVADLSRWLDRTPAAEWPDFEERKAMLAELRQYAAKKNDDAELARHVQNFEKMVRDDDAKQQRMPEDEDGPRSPWNQGPGELLRLRDAVVQINATLGMAAGVAEPARDMRYPPAPLAILRRRLRNEQSPHARLRLLLDLVDLTVKYDACVSLALLAAVDPGHAAGVFAKAIAKDKYRRADLLFALGDWKATQEHARRELKKLLEVGRLPAGLAEFARLVCEPLAEKVAAEVTTLVRLRNDLVGHGFTTTDTQTELDGRDVAALLGRLDALLPHLSQRMLLHVASSTRTRRDVTLRYRKLVHDNTVFEIESLTIPAADAPTFHDGEMYLLVEPRGVLLPLHPWLVYRTQPGGHDEALWFLDGLRKHRAVYKSPQMPGDQKLESEVDFDDVRDRLRP